MDEPSARKILAKLGVKVLAKSDAGWLQARCPLAPWTHAKGTDKHPGFGVKINDAGISAYDCRACKYHGRLSGLVRVMEEFSGRRFEGLAVEADRADMAGAFGSSFDSINSMLNAEFEEPEVVDEVAIEGIYPPVTQVAEAMDYLAGRGIGPGTADLLGMCYDPDDFRVMFPVRGRRGELYGFTGRSILREEHYPYRHYPKVRDYLGLPKRLLLLGAHLWQPGKPAFAVEGLMGFASLVEQGVREIANPLCLMGSEVTPGKAYGLAELEANVYLMPDNDAAGEACLFGKVKVDGSTDYEEGGIRRLTKKGALVFVPEWPLWSEDTEHNGTLYLRGTAKDDPDQLTFADVEEIIRDCPLWTG